MFGTKSPIESAYIEAVTNRLFSMVYFVLNQVFPPKERKQFRKDWEERSTHQLTQLLKQSASLKWESHPGAFWINPWIAEQLRAIEADRLYYIVDQGMEGQPLPPNIDADPSVEDRKVRDLHRLFSALNR